MFRGFWQKGTSYIFLSPDKESRLLNHYGDVFPDFFLFKKILDEAQSADLKMPLYTTFHSIEEESKQASFIN